MGLSLKVYISLKFTQGTFLYFKALTNKGLEATEDFEVERWLMIWSGNKIGDHETGNLVWFMKKWIFFFPLGVLKLIAWGGAEKKRNASKSDAVSCVLLESVSGWKKVKDSDPEGSHFHFPPGLAMGFLYHKKGTHLSFLYCSIMEMSGYYCQNLGYL